MAFIYLRQCAHAPPAGIALWPAFKAVPGIVFRRLRLKSARLVIRPVRIKIAAVKSGMVKHAVKQHPHALLPRACAQLRKQCLVAQQRVNLHIVGRIIAVVRRGFKHRTDIQGGYMQAFQIRKFFDEPAQIPAEKIAVCNLSAFIRQKVGRIRPVSVQPAARGRPLSVFIAEKAIDKNLIGNALPKPRGHLVRFVIDRQLEIFLPAVGQHTRAAGLPRLRPKIKGGRVCALKPKTGPHRPGHTQRIQRSGKTVACAGKPAPRKRNLADRAAKLARALEHGAGNAQCPRRIYRIPHLRTGGYRAERLLAALCARIKDILQKPITRNQTRMPRVCYRIFAPGRIPSKNNTRTSFSSLSAAKIIPFESTPRSLTGMRFDTSTIVFPTRSSGRYQLAMPLTT